MKKKIAYVFATMFLLAGCFGPVTPEERGIEVRRDIHKIYHQDKVLLHFEALVEEEYDVKLPNLWEDAKIWWTDTKCPYNDKVQVIYRSTCKGGRMWSIDEMYVALPTALADGPIEDMRTCNTAMVHEFGHALYMELNAGDGDIRHSDTRFWDIVDEGNKYACARGF